jgi:hypothetical protein
MPEYFSGRALGEEAQAAGAGAGAEAGAVTVQNREIASNETPHDTQGRALVKYILVP